MSVEEIMGYLGVSKDTVYTLVCDKRMFGHWRVDSANSRGMRLIPVSAEAAPTRGTKRPADNVIDWTRHLRFQAESDPPLRPPSSSRFPPPPRLARPLR